MLGAPMVRCRRLPCWRWAQSVRCRRAGCGGRRRNPYKPEALATKKQNKSGDWLNLDPEIKCYLPGVPRATYMPYPFQIFQSASAITFVYEYAGAVRNIYLRKPRAWPDRFWMGQSVGHWEGDTLVIDVTAFNDPDLVRPRRKFPQRQAARGGALHAHQSGHHVLRSQPSKTQAFSRGHGRSACRSIGARKRTRSSWISSAWSLSKSCCMGSTGKRPLEQMIEEG